MKIDAMYEWRRFSSQHHPVVGDYLKLFIELDENSEFKSIESRPFVCIQPQRFLEECEEFIERFLFLQFLCSLCRPVTESIMFAIQNRFQFVNPHSPAIAREPQEFLLHLFIVVRYDNHPSRYRVATRDITVENGPEVEINREFDMGVRMVPTSREAIPKLLKKSKVTESDHECCVICMEELHVGARDGNAKEVSSMHCGHKFHHECILTWLLTSHKCPLCCYSLPTAHDSTVVTT